MGEKGKHFLNFFAALAIVALLLPTGPLAAETIKVGILLPLLKLIWPKNLANADYVYPVNWLSEWGY